MADYSMLFGGVQQQPANLVGSFLQGQQVQQKSDLNRAALAGQNLQNQKAQNALDMDASDRLSHIADGLAAMPDDNQRNRAYQSILPHLQKLDSSHQWPPTITQQDAKDFSDTLKLIKSGKVSPDEIRAQQLELQKQSQLLREQEMKSNNDYRNRSLDAESRKLDMQGRQFDSELDYKNRALQQNNQNNGYHTTIYGPNGTVYDKDVRSGAITVQNDPVTGKPLVSGNLDSTTQGNIAREKTLATGDAQRVNQAAKGAGDEKDVNSLLDKAESLIDDATGSGIGEIRDSALSVVGQSTKAGDAAAQLRTLEGALIMKMPRMEGPQSDSDRLLYKQMAAQIGDASVPASQRKAASAMLRSISSKYTGKSEKAAPSNGERPPLSSFEGN